MDEKIRTKPAASPRVSARLFSIARSDTGTVPHKEKTGITIQIRLKNGAAAKLVSRKNTEFWLSATD